MNTHTFIVIHQFTRSSQVHDALVHQDKVRQLKPSVSHEVIRQSALKHIQHEKRCSCTNLKKQKKQDTRHVRTFTFQHVGVSRPVNVHTSVVYACKRQS